MYKISASLEEHSDDVRDVTFPHPTLILSASRDATVRQWRIDSYNPQRYGVSVSSRGTSFINAIAYIPPTNSYPRGLVVSGGKDAIIEVRNPEKPSEEDAETLLLGHNSAVCALDVCLQGGYVISGSWDNTARLWSIGKWECTAVLEGHEGSVWAVLGYETGTIITGCADQLIRIYKAQGTLLRTIKGSAGPVRALCRFPLQHTSGADFASAGNDGVIRLWKLDGRQIGELHGHESFIYSLAILANGELISSGEDRTVRIWTGQECVQTITHPAISVWCVAACFETGDIVSGASDRIVRIFSRAKERQGTPAALKAFADAVKSSSIPQQQIESLSKETIPGPEFLSHKSGTKEGQIQMIKEINGNVTAHEWSHALKQWTNVGTVVDAVGSDKRKISHLGIDYDYVFDVDIAEGVPPLKLPYNVSQNPYEVASIFVADNQLPTNYVEQVAQFIISNTNEGHEAQQTDRLTSKDPSTSSEDSSRKGSGMPASSRDHSRRRIIPQTTYLAIKSVNISAVLSKIAELNQKLRIEEAGDIALSQELLKVLFETRQPLENALLSNPVTKRAITDSIPIVLHMLTSWPISYRLPALDLIRLLAAATPALADYYSGSVRSIIDDLSTYAFDDMDRSNNVMLAVRAFSNLFETLSGRNLAESEFERIMQLVEDAWRHSEFPSNRNFVIAVSTLYLNYAVLFTSSTVSEATPSGHGRALLVLKGLTSVLTGTPDSEAIYRSLVAAGTLLSLGRDVMQAAIDTYALKDIAVSAESRIQEVRVRNVVQEIQDSLELS